MVKTLILFCLTNVDPSSCSYDTAVRHLRGPDAMPAACALYGETIVAAAPHPILGKEYARIQCERMTAER